MIDKNIPRELNSDIEERLAPEGVMIDAVNVMYDEDGDNTSGVLKNVRGNRAVTAPIEESILARETVSEEIFDIRSIGSVRDDVNGMIYWFVCSVSATDPQEDCIIQQNVADDTYVTILEADFLNFDPDSFVKGDVVSGYFGDSKVLQTILYFTDGINPPRKINIDRHLSTGYVDNADVIQVIKPGPLGICDGQFETDVEFDSNNLSDSGFQFATQYIYYDGEESAISPYSRLLVGRAAIFKNMSVEDTGVHPMVDNTLNVTLNTDVNAYDVSKVRVLARTGIDAPWLAVDEFPIDRKKDLNIGNRTITVYDPATNVYKFYNDTYYAAVASVEKNKLFDNVPFTAKTQAIVGNRLVYGNYTEGRTNNDENTIRGDRGDQGGNGYPVGETPSVSGNPFPKLDEGKPVFDVLYSDADAASENLIDVANLSTHITQNSGNGGLKQRIDVDFNGLFGGSGTTIPAGTMVTLEIPYRPSTNNNEQVYFDQANFLEGDDGYGLFKSTAFNAQFDQGGALSQNWYYNMRMKESNLAFTIPEDTIVHDHFKFRNQNIKVEFLMGTSSTVADVANRFEQELQDVTQTIRVSLGEAYSFRLYNSEGDWTDESIRPNPQTVNGLDGGDLFFDLTYKFKSIDQGDNTITIRPCLHSAKMVNGSFIPHPPGTDNETGDGINGVSGTDFSVPNTIQNQDVVFGRSWNWYNGSSDDENHEYTTDDDVTAVSDWIIDDEIVAKAVAYGTVPSFKAGSWHNFGVVYYDKFGRSGFVNEIGRAYVPWFTDPDRYVSAPGSNDYLSKRGPAQIKINFNNYIPPGWATHYQVVYAGRGSVGDFTQYSVAKAFSVKEKNPDYILGGSGATGAEYNDVFAENNKVIYVSLKTLDQYQEEKSTQRQYKFKEGDKLRIISGRYGAEPNNRLFPNADPDNSPIEFDILGVEYLDQAGRSNPIDQHPYNNQGNEQYTGTFLKLSAPHIEAEVGGITSPDDPLVYNGWQWDYVSPLGVNDNPQEVNYWGKETIVEIYSPKKRTEGDVYYEIGHRFPINYDGLTYSSLYEAYLTPDSPQQVGNPHHNGTNGVVVSNGDIIYRQVPVKTPVFDQNTGDFNLYLEEVGDTNSSPSKFWQYKAIPLECESINEVITSNDWSRGRPHAVFPGARTTHEENGLSFSEAWEQSVSTLLFSSFNPTLANFDNVDRAFGPIQYLGSLDSQSMICMQEGKMSIIPINENIIQQSNGNSIAALSTRFINKPRYMSEDFGCGKHPESVFLGEGMMTFIDPAREKFIQYIGGQLVPISDKGIAADLEDEFDLFNADTTGWKRLLTGMKPDNTMAFFTVRRGDSDDPDGKTWGYNYAGRNWSSRYSMIPDTYEYMDNTMYTARYGDEDEGDGNGLTGYIIWAHDSNVYNTFYDEQEDSSISIVSKVNPSSVKLFNAISYEGDVNDWTANLVTSLGQNVAALDSGAFIEREGGYYSALERDSSAESSSHIVGIGQVSSQDGNEITFKNKVANINFPSNSVIRRINGGVLEDIGTDIEFSSVDGARKISVSGTGLSVSEDDQLVAVGTNVLDGDHARGHYATITMTNDATNQIELYCVNTHITESKHNHRMGQSQ